MTKTKFALTKSGTLHILWLLGKKREVRFGQLTTLPMPRRTIAIRLRELQNEGLVERREHSDGLGSVAFHGYILTKNGLRLVNRIGIRSLERIISAEQADSAEEKES